jgi:hypothetical protein
MSVSGGPTYEKMRADPRFKGVLSSSGLQGVPLVEEVIARVKAEGWPVLESGGPLGSKWLLEGHPPRPLPSEVLRGLKLPSGRPVPPPVLAWLSFDAGWLASLGWLKLDPFEWTPRSVARIAHDELRLMGTGEWNWLDCFDEEKYREAFFLPGAPGLSCIVYSVGDRPDRFGDHELGALDCERVALLIHGPGFDVWLGQAAGLLSVPKVGREIDWHFKDRRGPAF